MGGVGVGYPQNAGFLVVIPLVGSISYLYILSSNFRRCVMSKVSCKNFKIFGNFLKFVNFTLSFLTCDLM